MNRKYSRRIFIKEGSYAGLASFAGLSVLSRWSFAENNDASPEVIVATGTDYYENTRKAVDLLGGMRKFAGTGKKIGLLVNADFEDKGAYVNPDIVLSVIRQCIDAGASGIVCLQNVKDEYWKRSAHFDNAKTDLEKVRSIESNTFPAQFNEIDFQRVAEIPGAILLKDVEMVKAIDECDVFINIAIGKHHATTLYTGALKNMMGICTRKSNVFMHLGSGTKNDPQHLGQCLSDINLYRKPDLVIIDSTYFITTNGPSGPGEISQPDKIIAATDIVAADALGARLLGYSPQDILHIVNANEAGQGEIDLSKILIKTLNP